MRLTVALGFTVVLLAACGQMGPLYLPDTQPAHETATESNASDRDQDTE